MKNLLELHLEGLEDREMLAVNVSQNGGRLRIVSDNASDVVDINSNTTPGGIQININGVSEGLFTGVSSIKAIMRGGDDILNVSAIDIAGNLTVRMGLGADEFDLDTIANGGGVVTGDGNVSIGGNVRVNMGGNPDDFVEWDGNLTDGFGIEIGGNVALRGASDIDLDGDGATFNQEAEDISIAGKLKIVLRSFGDVGDHSEVIYVDDVNVGGTARIRGSIASDDMYMEDVRFLGKTIVRLGLGDDTLDLAGVSDENFFDQRVVFSGGLGDDTLIENPGNVFNGVEKQFGFETVI